MSSSGNQMTLRSAPRELVAGWLQEAEGQAVTHVIAVWYLGRQQKWHSVWRIGQRRVACPLWQNNYWITRAVRARETECAREGREWGERPLPTPPPLWPHSVLFAPNVLKSDLLSLPVSERIPLKVGGRGFFWAEIYFVIVDFLSIFSGGHEPVFDK